MKTKNEQGKIIFEEEIDRHVRNHLPPQFEDQT